MSNSMKEKKEKIVVFSGAGMSAESGLKTFRDNNGLWENYDVMEVATPEAWRKNPELVLRFYNERRKQLMQAKANEAHYLVAKLQESFNTVVITQNIDNLHEQAGSKNVIHLHGELMKAQSERYPNLVYNLEKSEIKLGDLCERGHQLRPHVVWFGEAVPMLERAAQELPDCDYLIVIGTSLNVYPAASLVHYASNAKEKFTIDPKSEELNLDESWTILNCGASEGMEIVYEKLRHKKGG